MITNMDHTSHWSERNQGIGKDLSKFLRDNGNMFGVTTLATFAASAMVATVMTGDATHPMVAQDLKAIASSVGLTGALASAPMFVAAAIANKLADRVDTPSDALHGELARTLGSASEGKELHKHIKATAHLVSGDPERRGKLHAVVGTPEALRGPEAGLQDAENEDWPSLR